MTTTQPIAGRPGYCDAHGLPSEHGGCVINPSKPCLRCGGPTTAAPDADILLVCRRCTAGDWPPPTAVRTIKRPRRKTWSGWVDWLHRD